MKNDFFGLCLVSALAISSSAHASLSCEDEIREAVLHADGRADQGQSCDVETPSTGWANVTCGSETAKIEFSVSAAPTCKVTVLSVNTAEDTSDVVQPLAMYPSRCGYAPIPCSQPTCNPRLRPCTAPPMQIR
jgi:hypothetical protein